MKALVYEGPKQLVMREVPEPEPRSDEVKIKVRACGICGSDVHGYAGLTGRRTPPMVMGHEFAGDIVAAGAKVKNFKIGDRAAVYPVEICGGCVNCVSGSTHMCLHKKAYGVLDCNGALAEYICVPERIIFKISDHVGYDEAAMIEPLAVAGRGVGHAGSLTGRNVLIVGAGTIGLFALAMAKLQQPASIIVSDINNHRLETARMMGADHTINPEENDITEKVLGLTGNSGADITIECVGHTPAASQSVSCLRTGGKAVWIGLSARFVEADMHKIVTKELSVAGSFLYTLNDFEKVLNLLNQNKLDIRPVISSRISLEEAPEMFDRLLNNPGRLIKVVVVF